jgi:hypothetical protein
VSPPDERWKQKVQELLDTYAVTVRKLSDEALLAMHREYLRLNVDELIEITRAELARRELFFE